MEFHLQFPSMDFLKLLTLSTISHILLSSLLKLQTGTKGLIRLMHDPFARLYVGGSVFFVMLFIFRFYLISVGIMVFKVYH